MTKHESTPTEQKIEDFAEDLGRMLGTARAKAEGWLGQRQAIAKHLAEIRETASKLLTDLGHEAQRAVRRGRPAGSGRGPGRPKSGPGRRAGSGRKRRTMSAEARKAISEAQKKRWAAQKAAEKKK
jgi:hypothetical protein